MFVLLLMKCECRRAFCGGDFYSAQTNVATKGLYNTLSCLILLFIFENVRFPKAFTLGQNSHSVIIREVSDV